MNATVASPASLWDGFWGIQLLHIGQSLGLFEALAEPRSDKALATSMGLELHFTSLWCRAAASAGLLSEVEGRYQTPAESREWLEQSQGFTSSHVHLVSRMNETLEAVFHGRALPEPPIALKLVLQKALQRNYQWLYQEVPEAVPEFEKRLKSCRKMLEVGCGLGLGLLEMGAHYPSAELYGLEGDYECAREAERATRAVVHIGQHPRFDTQFDLIVSFRSLGLVDEPGQLIKECYELLTPGGWFVVGTEMECKSERKSELRSSSERFAYELLAGESKLRFLNRKELEEHLKAAGFKIENEIDGPDWATPLILCSR